MFSLIRLAKRRKGVSPVIAVVLLIALTVAAAAVIWAITQGLIGGVASITHDNVSATSDSTATTVRVSITVSADASITSAVLVQGAVSHNMAVDEADFTANDENTVTFTNTTNIVTALTGNWDLEITFNIDGDDQDYTIAVNF